MISMIITIMQIRMLYIGRTGVIRTYRLALDIIDINLPIGIKYWHCQFTVMPYAIIDMGELVTGNGYNLVGTK